MKTRKLHCKSAFVSLATPIEKRLVSPFARTQATGEVSSAGSHSGKVITIRRWLLSSSGLRRPLPNDVMLLLMGSGANEWLTAAHMIEIRFAARYNRNGMMANVAFFICRPRGACATP
jgi:hypothetical protein